MKFSFLFNVILCSVLVQSFFIPTAGGAQQTDRHEGIQIHSVQADFIQEKHLKILVRPILSTGIFIFQAPGSLRWEYRTPVASILLMHEGRIKKFIRQQENFREDRAMGLDAIQVVLTEISNWLDGRFTDNALFRVSFPDRKTILLTPRKPALAGIISSITLKLAEQKGLLDSVTIFEGPDSFTTMTFSNRTLNKSLPDTLFTTP